MTIKHFIRKCEFCRKVIAQCRCPSLDKKIEWGVCHECLGRDRLPVQEPS